jgi:hypothetical protein
MAVEGVPHKRWNDSGAQWTMAGIICAPQFSVSIPDNHGKARCVVTQFVYDLAALGKETRPELPGFITPPRVRDGRQRGRLP